MAGRAGTTFGDPEAAAKGDTSKEAQFKKSAGDFSRNDSGAAPPDVGSTVCPVMPMRMCPQATHLFWQLCSPQWVDPCVSLQLCC